MPSLLLSLYISSNEQLVLHTPGKPYLQAVESTSVFHPFPSFFFFLHSANVAQAHTCHSNATGSLQFDNKNGPPHLISHLSNLIPPDSTLPLTLK